MVTIAAALCGMVAASDPQQTVFRGTGDTVRVFVTATDKSERLATSLPRDVFEVRDNGRPQPITVFDNSPQPIRLIVMLDVSGSMERNLPLLRAASVELFNRLGPDVGAKVGTFGHTIEIMPEFTKDARACSGPAGRDPAGRANPAVARDRSGDVRLRPQGRPAPRRAGVE
jgi:hypothetical protein